MTNNMHAPNERPAQKGHGLFDVLPQRRDPLPEGHWFVVDDKLHLIVCEGDYVTLWNHEPEKNLTFYGLFWLWCFGHLFGIPYLLRAWFKEMPSTDIKDWLRKYPWLWGWKMVFHRSNFLATVCSPEFQRWVRARRRAKARHLEYVRYCDIHRWDH